MHMYTLTMEPDTTNAYVVLDGDAMDDIKAWDFNETGYSSSGDNEFPLLIEVSDDEIVIKNKRGKALEQDFPVMIEDDSFKKEPYNMADEIVYKSKVLFAASRAGEKIPLPKEERKVDGRSSFKARETN